jgi:NTP pyrophosphatase (non-canonical NTP hydrolase)
MEVIATLVRTSLHLFLDQYVKDVLKTESQTALAMDSPIQGARVLRGLHASLGISTEAGELLDAYKKHIFYNKPLDLVNIEEELGDLCWYISLMIDVLRGSGHQTSWGQIWEKNIEKLKKRYGDKFNQEGALNRDLQAEREILERKT